MQTSISQHKTVPELTPAHAASLDVKTRFVAALLAGDWEAAGALMHPDFTLHEPVDLAYGGVYKGLDGFKKCLSLIPQLSHKTEHLETIRTYFSDDPNTIVAELHSRGIANRNGEKFTNRVLEEFCLVDGKVFSLSLFWFEIPDFLKKA